VKIDTEDAVIEEHRYGKSNIERELTKWGSFDLHVPKKMALYNGDGERFLKGSLTKTNKLAKYQNQTQYVSTLLMLIALTFTRTPGGMNLNLR
jgi:hypothetical protein